MGEVPPESSASSVAPTIEASETTKSGNIRNAVCRPTGAANKQQILDLACAGLTVSQIAAQVDVAAHQLRRSNDRFGSGGRLLQTTILRVT